MGRNRMTFMNTFLDNVTEQETLEYINERVSTRNLAYVIPLNVDEIVRIEYDKYFKEILEQAGLILADGHPLLWVSKWYHKPIKQKICGSDLFPVLCQMAAKKGYSVFLLGAAPGVAARAATKLKATIPGLKVAGTYSPPMGFEKDQMEIEKINRMLKDSRADILFVGLGVPKQEIFIYENMEKYQIPVSLAVGASIDFIAGEQKRAPKWMRDCGMEWLYRLLREPKRMFKRYCIDDMKILKLAWKYRPQQPETLKRENREGAVPN